MPNKMLIDATHTEETRVVVLKGKRVEEFDLESAARRQLRGNIYLAKVTRVEPSLQAAFVDYGGNRHGFLAFGEIHPDYYQIPVADRQALLADAAAAEAEAAAEEEDEADAAAGASRKRPRRRPAKARRSETTAKSAAKEAEVAEGAEEATPEAEAAAGDGAAPNEADDAEAKPARGRRSRRRRSIAAKAEIPTISEQAEPANGNGAEEDFDVVGAEDALEEVPDRHLSQRRRTYKIQEVIKRRQILLVQVVKEERGTKGAALTTYLSLAGRYCVLMPNTARGGGISRKITNPSDRRQLKAIAGDLEVPAGMGVIVRTAGANRTKAEIKRDFEYLLRMWETVRSQTLKSTAPALIYEEGSLIKRAIRDLYSKDIDEVLVEGEDGYKEAKTFMRMLMPSHAKNIKLYKEDLPLFMRGQVESQLDQMFSPTVTLPSGGYLVINQTEALVAIDVNSGKSTREHNIEDTAAKTNLEAAAEVARQLRLRDLAGLIVIDFIDMDENRNNRAVERKLKECLKTDRARIQVGRISHFGILEMSRQRIRASVTEGTMDVCPHCQGSGRVRSVGSSSLQILRALEEKALDGGGRNLTIRTNVDIALYMLNQKRAHIAEIEHRFGIAVGVIVDDTLLGSSFVIERGAPSETASEVRKEAIQIESGLTDGEIGVDEADEDIDAEAAEAAEDGERGKRRRRRRRGRRRTEDGAPVEATGEPAAIADADRAAENEGESAEDGGERPRRRRGRRGGRRQRRNGGAEMPLAAEAEAGRAAEAAPFENAEPPHTQVEAPAESEAEAAPTDEAPERQTAEAQPADASRLNGGSDALPVETAPVETAAAETVAAETVAPEPVPVETAEAEPPRKPRRRTTAKAKSPAAKKAEVAADDGQSAAPAGEAAVPSEPAAESQREPAAPAGPSRSGWWQRRLFPGG